MDSSICRSCQKKTVVKCCTCNELYCETHSYSCKINPSSHKLINWPPPFGTLFDDLKKKLQGHIKMIESSSSKIIGALMSLKRNAFKTVQDDLKYIESLEIDFEKNLKIGQNMNTVLNRYLNAPDDKIKEELLSSITYNIRFEEILKIINLTTNPIKLDRDMLIKSEVILKNRPNFANPFEEKPAAERKASDTLSTLTKIKKEFANHIELSNIFQMMKMEQVSYRETVTEFIINNEKCSSSKAALILCDSLSLFPNLNTIVFERLNPDQVEGLLHSLKIPEQVKHISFDRCIDIGTLELKEIKKKLESLKLESFGFKYCNCLSEGVKHVVSKFATDRLTHLILPGNLLGYEGSIELSNCLIKFTCLTHLNLRNNDLTVREMLNFKAAFSSLTRLKHLDIAANELKISGIKELLKGIKKSQLLAYLDISSNKLADEDDESIKSMFSQDFKELRLLETLVLDMTIKKDQLAVLREVLPKFTYIFCSNSDNIQPLPKNFNS